MCNTIRFTVPPCAALFTLFLLTDPAPAAPPVPDEAERFTIHLGAAESTPAAGWWTPPVDADAPFLVQLYDLPGEGQVERWRRRGITLLRYVGGNAYVVRAPGEGGRALASSSSVRAALALAPEMKRSRLFDADPALAARAASGERLGLHLSFFPHVDFARARELLADAGIETEDERFGYGQTIRARATWRQLGRLLESPDVAWADPGLPPIVLNNLNAAERARVDRVLDLPGFRGADGSGVRVGIWDFFSDGDHVDWRDRVVRAAVQPIAGALHGLAVSGTVAGAGILDPKARGMAPGAILYWYTLHEDLWSVIAAERAANDVRITNHSWGFAPGWHQRPDGHWNWNSDLWVFGYYHLWTSIADDLALNQDVLLVTGPGNNRELSYLGPHTHGDYQLNATDDGISHQDLHAPHPAYGLTNGPGAGKNVLSVGATTKDDAMSSFAGWGPTGDGRVKPDVVAVGVNVMTTGENDNYGWGTGVSFSVPVVSGAAALLADYYSRTVGEADGSQPSSLMLKTLLIHGARDLGRRGPDYSYGHGMIDAQLSARVLRATSRGEPRLVSLIAERRLAHGQKRRVMIDVTPGARDLRATLAWHDPPGERLVNDLDLWLVSPSGGVARPFVLDPAEPRQRATTGPNRIDNVESVRLKAPEPGRWKAFVRATRVPMGPQTYALVVSAGDGHVAPPRLRDGDCDVTGFFATDQDPRSPSAGPKSAFRHGDPLYLTTRVRVPANASYGDYHGSIYITWIVTGGDGEVVLKTMTSSTRWHVLPEGRAFSTPRYQIPAGLPAGSYLARTVVRMHNGARSTAEFPFRVEVP